MDTTAEYTATESATLSTIDEMSENEMQAVAEFRKSLLSAESATGHSASLLPVDEVAEDSSPNEVFEVSVSDSKLERETLVSVRNIEGAKRTSLEQDIDTILTSTRINSEKSDFEYSGEQIIKQGRISARAPFCVQT